MKMKAAFTLLLILPTILLSSLFSNVVLVHAVQNVELVADISDDVGSNQELTPVTGRRNLILERTFTVSVASSGEKDYSKYTYVRSVKFPFDVYMVNSSGGSYIPANTPQRLSMQAANTEFYLPVWVDEGDYDVEFKEEAIYTQPNGDATSAAGNMIEYFAKDTVPVHVSGRIYGFKVTDVDDYPLWEGVFRKGSNTAVHSGKNYYVGTKNENGSPTGLNIQYTLPLMPGSHPAYSNKGVLKTGNGIKFDLITTGNYAGDNDYIKITPTFWHVSKDGDKDGKGRQQVDIYYTEYINGKDEYYVKVGSNKDVGNLHTIKLGNPYRNVPNDEITNTCSILALNHNKFRNQAMSIGSYGSILLSKSFRTFIGDKINLPPNSSQDFINKAAASKQRWYGEYWLPNTMYAVKVGTNVYDYARKNGLDGKESFWLKDGYIIVNFKIETVKNNKPANPVLGYWNAPQDYQCNMWEKEGFFYGKIYNNTTLFQLYDGDVAFYYPNKRSSDDWQAGGTH